MRTLHQDQRRVRSRSRIGFLPWLVLFLALFGMTWFMLCRPATPKTTPVGAEQSIPANAPIETPENQIKNDAQPVPDADANPGVIRGKRPAHDESMRVAVWTSNGRGVGETFWEPRWASDGSFAVEGLALGRYIVYAAMPDRVASQRVKLTADSPVAEVSLDFEPGACISGRVVDLNQAPVSGIKIGCNVGMPIALTKDRFWLAVPKDEPWLCIWGRDDSLAGFVELKLPPSPQESADVLLVLKPEARVAGHVLDEYRQPVAGLYLWAVSDVTDKDQIRATSGEQGEFLFSGLMGGNYMFKARRAYNENIEDNLQKLGFLSVEPGDSVENVVFLYDGWQSEINGRVTDPEGFPIEGAEIKVYPLENEKRAYYKGRVETDAAGIYHLTGLFRANYRIRVEREGYALAHSKEWITAPKTGVNFTLEPMLAMEGDVVDADTGVPVDKFNAGLAPVATAESLRDDFNREEYERGHFRIETSFEGHYLLLIEADGYRPSVTSVEVTANPAAPTKISLSAGSSVRGTVKDLKGNPVEYAKIEFAFAGQVLRNGASADEKGKFEVNALFPGQNRIVVDHRNFARYETMASLPVGETVLEDIVLQEAPSLYVIVRENGAPVSADRCNATATRDDLFQQFLLSETDLQTLQCWFPAIQEGSYWINVKVSPDNSDQGAWREMNRKVAVAAQSPNTVYFDLPPANAQLTGRVTLNGRRTSGEVQLRVSEEATSQRDYFRVRIDDQGRYLFQNIPSGPALLYVCSDDVDGKWRPFSGRVRTMPVDIPASGVLEQDIDIQDNGSISGNIEARKRFCEIITFLGPPDSNWKEALNSIFHQNHMHFQLFTANENLVDRGFYSVPNIPPGRYRLTAIGIDTTYPLLNQVFERVSVDEQIVDLNEQNGYTAQVDLTLP